MTEAINGLAKGIGEMFAEIWGVMWPFIIMAVSFILWVLAACIILPCVFVANTIYPLWEKWGDQF